MAEPARTATTEIAGRRLAWRSLGHGPPLLLVNGYAATGVDWNPRLLARLAESFEVICPDNRGVGDSQLGDLGDGLTIDGMAQDLEALLDALRLDSAPVAGWSMGGFVAQRLAARAPARVEALVLLSSDPGGATAIDAEPEVWARLIDNSGTPREQATRLISLLFPARLAPAVDREFGEIVAASRAGLSARVLQAQAAAMVAWHEQPQAPLGSSPPPVLAATGSEDVVIPPQNLDALAARWPRCRTQRFAGGGHAFMAQEPIRVADLMRSFLQLEETGSAAAP